MLVDPLTNKPVRTYFMYEDQPPYKRVGACNFQLLSSMCALCACGPNIDPSDNMSFAASSRECDPHVSMPATAKAAVHMSSKAGQWDCKSC
jgi:hypothetical protein